MTATYHLVTHWRVRGTLEDVADVLSDPLDLPRWWPAVYLQAVSLSPGGPDGIGRQVWLRTRGWLPYTLEWVLEVMETRYPRGFTIAASRDLVGSGRWTLMADGQFVDATFDWHVEARKPLLRYGSWLLRPLFEANHRWAMREGQGSLERELAKTDQKDRQI